ncbi:phytoene desaturase family protein [Deinococcus navajonensis]|uniref:Phytoene desaturase family protein n=1 Tax=Deinococcus navajonensis TaxID=309884 RepID=A0ABV8XM70_9DEIO
MTTRQVREIGILGGGVAGLSMAALLAARGHAVRVYERDRAGGKLRRIALGDADVDTGPSLFTFPGVWQAYLHRLGEPDLLNLQPLPGGLGVHHTPFGALPLPVPPDHPSYSAWQRYVRRAAPLAPQVTALLTTPPRLRDPAFRRLGRVLFGVTGRHLTAAGWLRAQGLPPDLHHALGTHALNAGLVPQDAPALYALIPALVGNQVFRPAAGMGALLDGLLSLGQTRGVQLKEGTAVVGVSGQTLTLEGGEVRRHDLLISAMDPARLARLRGHSVQSRVNRRTVSGVALYATLPAPAPWATTNVLPPGDFRHFRSAVRQGNLPTETLALVHADGGRVAILLTAPATAEALSLDRPWVQAQVARVERTLGTPGLLASALDVAVLPPSHYALGGHPGGALYGAVLPVWRSGPLHPQPYRLSPGLWQVGTGVHPGGGLPAVLGGVLIVDQLLREAGI